MKGVFYPLRFTLLKSKIPYYHHDYGYLLYKMPVKKKALTSTYV